MNLTDKIVPPEVIAVLSKRVGFVMSSTHNSLETKTDCYATMGKLCNATKRRIKVASNHDEPDSQDADESEQSIPPSLRRDTGLSGPTDCGDKIVNQLAEEVMDAIDLLKPKKQRSNLSKKERNGLKWILKEIDSGDVRVVQADKGGALCIVPKAYIKRLEQQKLNDDSKYINLGEEDPSPDALEVLLNKWREGEDNDHVNGHESHEVVGLCAKKNGKQQRPSTASIFKPKIPYFYALLKIHKLKPKELVPGVEIPIRLVTNLSNSVTTRSDKFLNWKFLRPLQDEFCIDLARDSTEVIKWLEEFNKTDKPSKIYGFTWDFCALYDNLTPALVIEALKEAIKELRPTWTDSFVNWLIDLVQLSLDCSFARYGNNWYKSIIGIPTGGSLSVTLANIAVYYVLRKVIYSSTSSPKELLSLKRFVDDVSGMWSGTVEHFQIWSDEVNQLLKEYGLSIKNKEEDPWDINEPGKFTVFLDIKYTFDETIGLVTDVNIKETDARVYLHYSGFHPKQTFPSIVYSQALRYNRIINNTETLSTRLDELQECFLRSGYPYKMVKGIMEDVLKRPRKLEYKEKSNETPFPVAWVQTYGPASNEIQHFVKDVNNVIKLSPNWKNEKKVIGLVNKRGRNIGDLVLKRKQFALNSEDANTGTQPCTLTPKDGEKRAKRGRPCESCKLMSKKNSIQSHVTGKKYHTPSANCKSKTLIYVADCLQCQKQYTGKTIQKFRGRISGHRTHVNKTTKSILLDTDEAALSDHLKTAHSISSTELFNLTYSFTAVQLDPPNLERSEQTWVNRLVTMQPYGLNVEKPCGVTDSIITMSQKAKPQRS